MKTRNGFLLLALFALYYLIPLEFRPLWQPDETRYAQIGREMLSSGNWVVPHFFELRYFEKPVAGYWLNNLSQLLFGQTNFAVRFGSVFSTAMTALLVYWLAWRLWRQREAAQLAVLIFLTSLMVFSVGSYAVLDPMVMLWLTAAMCSIWLAFDVSSVRDKLLAWLLTGVACGMGFMSKGFLALALPVIAVLPWCVGQKRLRELMLFGPLAIVSAAATVAPWALAIARAEPDFWHYFFWVEHIQRFAQEDAQHRAPFWYYLPILLAGCLPWLALLPGALRNGWRHRQQPDGLLYLLCWVVMPLLFFSLAKGKLLTYILPCFAPLALLLARQALDSPRALKANGLINLIFGAICLLIVALWLAPWGMAKRPLYGRHELWQITLAMLAFALWSLFGWLAWRAPEKRWRWAALSPLALALVVGQVIPEQIRDSKQPQSFIRQVAHRIDPDSLLLANDPAIASGFAWELRRSDIIFYRHRGEVKYGLSYADAADKFVAEDRFPAWLAEHRRTHSVSLILLLPRENDALNLPAADFHYRQGRFALYQYQQRP